MSDSALAQRSVQQEDGCALSLAAEVTLLEILERVLDKGVVIAGDLTISVAGVDLIYLGLRALLCSVETIKPPLATAVQSAKFHPWPRQRETATSHSALSAPHS